VQTDSGCCGAAQRAWAKQFSDVEKVLGWPSQLFENFIIVVRTVQLLDTISPRSQSLMKVPRQNELVQDLSLPVQSKCVLHLHTSAFSLVQGKQC